jgi:hypothetical protein
MPRNHLRMLMLFLAQNVFLSLIAVLVVLPLARKLIPVRS